MNLCLPYSRSRGRHLVRCVRRNARRSAARLFGPERELINSPACEGAAQPGAVRYAVPTSLPSYVQLNASFFRRIGPGFLSVPPESANLPIDLGRIIFSSEICRKYPRILPQQGKRTHDEDSEVRHCCTGNSSITD